VPQRVEAELQSSNWHSPAGGGPSRSGRFGLVTRGLGRLGPLQATALLVLFAIILAIGTHILIGLLFDAMPPAGFFAAAALVTIIVATPIVFQSQRLIRSLGASRHRLKRLTEELAVALSEKDNAYQAKSRFLSSMSHELRTPLNAILGFSDILANERFGPMTNAKYLEYAADIHASADHLLGVVTAILDLARIEAGQTILGSPAPVPLIGVFDSVARLLVPLAEQRSVHLDIQPPPTETGLLGNEQMMRQMLINILSNAIKFTPHGGQVTLAAEPNSAQGLALCVTDTGIGMSAEEIVLALQPFGQIDNAQNRRQGGTGLGLPLVRAMMALHDGTLEIESVPGRGTLVRLLFPAQRIIKTEALAPTR
jgi:Amt family ammonium transporter